jgi:hypothetical protein
MRIRSLLAGALATLLLSAPAVAQVAPRKVPADAKRGTYAPAPFPGAYIDGRLVRLAPGARVLMPNNLAVTPNQVPADSPIRYTLDAQGQVRMIWVLASDEGRQR